MNQAVMTSASPTDVAEHYNDLDEYYRALWGEHLHHGLWLNGRETVEVAVRNMIDLVAEKARAQDAEVCDVGCGYGGTSRVLAADYNARVTGVTVSEKQYEYARTQQVTDGNPKILLKNWMENDFPESQFDAVLGVECFTHMPDQTKFLSEAFRVLKPGGRMVLCVWMTSEEPTKSQRQKLLDPIIAEGRLTHMPTPSECAEMVASAGFEMIEQEDLSQQVAKTWQICVRRAIRRILVTPAYWKFLLDASQKNRVFVRTLFRLDKAFKSGCMKYGLIVAEKPR
ncbi:MAG: class I SAM-dependent methyltransferase [Planctomycetaceae bacterium]|jgi:tocopherol O-methyltransferase|nr:class I SAM-dependent methyltransferase [Planctomycetaceae bacterium]